MKKIITLAIVAFLGITQVEAQVTFRPGLRGGVNLTHFSKGDQAFYEDNSTSNIREFDSKTDFYLGFYGALKLSKYYTLQPEFDYSRQGSEFRIKNSPSTQTKLNVSYLGVQMINKFTFTDKFNVHLGPGIDFQVDEDFDTDSEVDLTFILGAGYHFTNNFGIEARVKKGIIPVLDYSDGNHTNVVFSLGATYTFDLK
jgi:hypothetical protein